MQIKTILKILGLLLSCFSFTMLPPIAVSLYYNESLENPFLIAFVMTFLSGMSLYIHYFNHKAELKSRDGFFIVTLIWVVLSLFAAIPLMMAPAPHDKLTDAIFEAVSGLTTTGASVVIGLEDLPHAILYYRQQLQFLGGMGIVVLAVAIMPMLGVGGMQLLQAETPGPFKEQKLAPRIATSAKLLWIIYILLTVLCALSFWGAGMDLFDAVGESFATVSTGGFAMHDSSFTYYHNSAIELLASLFMLLGAINFSLHFQCYSRRNFSVYYADEESRKYFCVLIGVIIAVATALYYAGSPYELKTLVVKAIFNVVSFSTTTGFVSDDLSSWPLFPVILITYLAIIGGCAASTSGGIKFVRILLLQKQTKLSLFKLIHPQAVASIRFGNSPLPAHIFDSVWSFVMIFLSVFFILVLLLVLTGLDFTTSFSAAAATLANAGAGIGKISSSFKGLSDASKWVLILAMLAGRLEIFTVFILFVPSFWKK